MECFGLNIVGGKQCIIVIIGDCARITYLFAALGVYVADARGEHRFESLFAFVVSQQCGYAGA